MGGRSTTVDAYSDPSQPVELGASIYVSVNKILVDAANEFNLSQIDPEFTIADAESKAPGLGFWNGKEFVYTVQGNGYWDLVKLAWHYGWYSPFRTQQLMKDMVGRFLQLYDEPFFPWGSLSEAVYEIGLSDMTATSGEQYLKEKGVSDKFAREFVQGATRVNYAQNLANIHGVEAMVCMATGAVSVKGGNWQIFAKMIGTSANQHLLSTEVRTIERQQGGTFTVGAKLNCCNTEADHPNELMTSGVFDTIILAAPYQFSSIDFIPPLQFTPETVPYVNLHVTLFTSPYRLSPTAFNLPPDQLVPTAILTTLPENEDPAPANKSQAGSPGIFSISTLRQVTNPSQPDRPEYLYKVFSPTAINATFLTQILGLPESSPITEPFPVYEWGTTLDLPKDGVTWIHRKLWQSYPYGFPRTKFEKLRLDDGIWYTAGMEGFISTMETSALSGMNVARLIVDELVRRRDDGSGGPTTKVEEEKEYPRESMADVEQHELKVKL
jgi:prenylcysteine oxidase/farnesylcysteine lyase